MYRWKTSRDKIILLDHFNLESLVDHSNNLYCSHYVSKYYSSISVAYYWIVILIGTYLLKLRQVERQRGIKLNCFEFLNISLVLRLGFTVKIMSDYGKVRVRENLYSRTFYTIFCKSRMLHLHFSTNERFKLNYKTQAKAKADRSSFVCFKITIPLLFQYQ